MHATFCESEKFRGHLFTYCDDHRTVESGPTPKSFIKRPTIRRHILCKEFKPDKVNNISNDIRIDNECIRLLTNNCMDDHETIQKIREMIHQKTEKILDVCTNNKYTFVIIIDKKSIMIDIYHLSILNLRTISFKNAIDRIKFNHSQSSIKQNMYSISASCKYLVAYAGDRKILVFSIE